MKNSLFHRFVDFLVKHDELHNAPSRVDISQDFFPINAREYKILKDSLRFYLSSVRFSLESDDESDTVISLFVKLSIAVKNGELVS